MSEIPDGLEEDQPAVEIPAESPEPVVAEEPIHKVVDVADVGLRLDWYLAREFPAFSRVHLRRLVNAAVIRVEGVRTKAAHRLRAGERIEVRLPTLVREAPLPEHIPLEILDEHPDFIVINKAPGMVVHPGKGHYSGTLTSALQFHFNELSQIGGTARPGIVHRLDRDTSGVMLVARTDRAHLILAEQFEQRTVEKEYLAIVQGNLDRDRDWIDQPIGFHPSHRERMAIRRDDPAARPAQSFYEVVERFAGYVAVRVVPKTGRTHQIRVHLAHVGCPVLCDRHYSGRAGVTRGELVGGDDPTVLLERQALHARRLCFNDPTTGQRREYVAPIPADLQRVLEELRRSRAWSSPSGRVN